MKKIYLLLAFITFTINAQKLPEKFQGYWVDSSITCDSAKGLKIYAQSTDYYPESGDFKKVIKINENSFKVIFDTVDNGEISLTLNLRDNNLEIKEQQVGEEGTIGEPISTYYKLCK
ncbi:MAG: hypothetical protein EAZ75_08975 [Flavobacteriia bacterium]|jgi:hypothetical protein|nr:MAG: hypothetical protein EAZ75_08975 [Flavobacteriia bacterium]